MVKLILFAFIINCFSQYGYSDSMDWNQLKNKSIGLQNWTTKNPRIKKSWRRYGVHEIKPSELMMEIMMFQNDNIKLTGIINFFYDSIPKNISRINDSIGHFSNLLIQEKKELENKNFYIELYHPIPIIDSDKKTVLINLLKPAGICDDFINFVGVSSDTVFSNDFRRHLIVVGLATEFDFKKSNLLKIKNGKNILIRIYFNYTAISKVKCKDNRIGLFNRIKVLGYEFFIPPKKWAGPLTNDLYITRIPLNF